MPSTIAVGETVTIPAGRVVVHPNLQVDGTLDIQGDLFIPSGGTSDQLVAKSGDTMTGLLNANGGININNAPLSTGQRKNYLINGNFDMWQYGTSQTTSGHGSDNRWLNVNSGSTKTHSRVACTDTERALFNANYFSRTVVSSVIGASNIVAIQQKIENVVLTAGKIITLSFWAKADSNKNIAIDLSQAFGTGGSPSAPIDAIGAQQVALTTTWQKKIITVTMPSIVGKTLGTDGVHTSSSVITYWFDAGSNNAIRSSNLGQQSGTFDIAQVKIEDGSVATDGWHPYDGEFGGEVQACQRYYQSHNRFADKQGYQSASDNNFWVVSFPTTMRVAPNVASTSSPSYGNIATPPTFDIYPSHLVVNALTATGTGTWFVVNYGISLSAEI